jgi:hypothetical protein
MGNIETGRLLDPRFLDLDGPGEAAPDNSGLVVLSNDC